MLSGTQYMLQKEFLYTVAVAYIWYLDSNNSNRVVIRNIVWPKMVM